MSIAQHEPVRLTGMLSRRRLLLGLGGGLVLAACGSSKNDSSVRRSGAAGNTGNEASPGTTMSPPAGRTVRLGGTHVHDAITESNAEYLASVSDGTWQGAWRDSAGHSGSSDVVVHVDATTRTATGRVAFGGNLLGSPVPDTTYVVDLLSYVIIADTYTVTTPQLGRVTIEPGGDGRMLGRATNIPGHPEIKEIRASGERGKTTAQCTYAVSYTDGHVVHGAMAWSTKGRAAAPAVTSA